MESPASRQDEFSFRLAQWLLDQIHSEEELKTVTQQFNVLFSQAQRELIEELYLHVGRLIFQKFTRTKTQYAQLCAQLCRSLFMANIKQRSDLSARPVPIHAHLFQCCLDYLSSSDAMQHSEAQRATRGTDRSGTSQPETCVSGAGRDSKEDRIVAISLLVLELCRCGLVSAIQVYEYTFQLTTLLSSGHSVNLLGTVYTLLDGYFSRLDTSLWKGELELLQNWVKYLIPDAGADQDHQEGAQQLTNLLNRMLNGEQGPDTNSEDPGMTFGRLSVSVTAQPIASRRDTSTTVEDDDEPPGLNNIVLDLGEIVYSPLSPSYDENGAGIGNHFGDYMHEAGSVDSLDALKKSNKGKASPALNAGTYRSQSKRNGHVIHPFAVVDSSQPESLPQVYPRHGFTSSEPSFSSAGSTHALPVPSPSTLHNSVAALILSKTQKKGRLTRVAKTHVEQEKSVKEKGEKVKRSKEDTVLDWLERESTTRGSFEVGMGR